MLSYRIYNKSSKFLCSPSIFLGRGLHISSFTLMSTRTLREIDVDLQAVIIAMEGDWRVSASLKSEREKHRPRNNVSSLMMQRWMWAFLYMMTYGPSVIFLYRLLFELIYSSPVEQIQSLLLWNYSFISMSMVSILPFFMLLWHFSQ